MHTMNNFSLNGDKEDHLQSVPSDFTVPIISASECTYERVLQDFFIPNIPFIVTGITDKWKAQHDWITAVSTTEETGKKQDTAGSGKELGDALKVGKSEKAKTSRVPNWDYLSREYGEFTVSVLQCPIPPSAINTNNDKSSSSSQVPSEDEQKSGVEREGEATYGTGEIIEMKFSDVIELWKNGSGRGMYVKDWHLKREMRERARARRNQGTKPQKAEKSPIPRKVTDPTEEASCNAPKDEEDLVKEEEDGEGEEESFYTTLEIFQNDWMDNYYTNNTNDDFSFVYFGTVGTFTPLHRDVYTSYSWSANIQGRKSWHLIPPSSIQHCRLYPSSSSNNNALHPDIRPGKVDTVQYPAFKEARVISVLQEEGSAIWVPSNWYHCVENISSSKSPETPSSSDMDRSDSSSSASSSSPSSPLEFVISINQNWCNELNLPALFKSMKQSIQETEEALSDVREVLIRRREMGQEVDVEMEWGEAVQGVLEMNVGWGWETFYSMIQYNLLHPPAPAPLRAPTSMLKAALSIIFADHELEKKDRTRAKSYDGALEAALRIMNS